MGAVVDDYVDARWRRAVAIAEANGSVKEIADRFGVHPAYVSKVRRAISTWGADDELKKLSIDRLYYGALLASKIGKAKARQLMLSKDSSTLAQLARGHFVRKRLPSVDEGIYEKLIGEHSRFSKIYYDLNGVHASFDRFIETILGVWSELDDDTVASIVQELWGDVYG